MVETKSASNSPQGSATAGGRTFGAGYIAPHPTLRKDAVDVDSFLEDHQVYTPAYLESVHPSHRTPAQLHEYLAWYWHLAARTLVGLLSGSLGSTSGLTERSLGKRILLFTSVGTVCGLAAAISNHVRSMLLNKPDNGWVHTAVANTECVRAHAGIVANLAWTPHSPPVWPRLFHLAFQFLLFLQVLPVYLLAPAVAYAYDAYRAEEQVFNYSQAIRLIEGGRLKGWKGHRAPGPAVSYYALPEGALVRDAMLRMRADEACIHQMSMLLADLSPGSRNPFIIMERKRGAS